MTKLSPLYLETCDGGLALRPMDYGTLIFRQREHVPVKYRFDEETRRGYVWHAEGHPYWHPILHLHRQPFTLVMSDGRKLKVFLRTLDGLVEESMSEHNVNVKRAYVVGCLDKETEGLRTPVKAFFTFHREEAAVYNAREDAESQCPMMDALGVRVDWAEGGEYVCKNFQVEERAPGEFVIFCEGPFTYKVAV